MEVSGKTAIDLIEDGSESMGMLRVTMGECSFFLQLLRFKNGILLSNRADLSYPVIYSHGFSVGKAEN